jgi:hypothetical protein
MSMNMGKSIPAYICSTCAKGFASARSARRHVKKLENGTAQVFTEAQYRLMLSTGVIAPPLQAFSAPRFKKKSPNPMELAKEEYMRGFYRRLGEKAADSLSPESTREMTSLLVFYTQREFLKASTDSSSQWDS